MHYKISHLPNSVVELQVTIPQADLEREVQKARESSSQKKSDEFKLYEHAFKQAAGQALETIFIKESLEPIEQPEITVTKLAPKNNAEFRARFAVMPSVKLPPNWKELIREAGKEKREPTLKDEEVRAALVWLQESRAVSKPVKRPAKNGDIVKATIRAFQAGKPIPNATLEHHTFILGRKTFLPGFEEKLEGLSKGDKKNFSLIAPERYWVKELSGKEIEFDVEIEGVEERIVPTLDDNFARSVGRFKNLEELITSIKEGLLLEKQEKEKERMRILFLERLSNAITIDVPKILLLGELDQMIQELKTSTERFGLAWEQYLKSINQTEEDIRTALSAEAMRRVKFALILRALADELEIEPTEEEIESEMQKQLLSYPSPKEAERHIDTEALLRYTRGIVRNEKAFQYLETIAAGRNYT
jgi:trigger factor